MNKIPSLVIITLIVSFFVCHTSFAYPAPMVHWANVRNDDYDCIFTVDEGEMVEVLEVSPLYPERTNIIFNGSYGSVLTEYIGDTITNEYNVGDNPLEYVPSGIYSKVIADVYIWDQYYNIIGYVPEGAYVEIIQLSPIDSVSMIINYNGIYGAILMGYIEPTYADNLWATPFEDCGEPIEEYAYTGIFSRVTTDLTIRDQNYNAIGSVPSGASVEIIQVSHDYSDRMVIRYDGIVGTILTDCIEPTYADNIGSEYYEETPGYTEQIEEYASTGIFSKVTADLTIRDECYNAIGGVPKGEYVEVIQKSHEFSDRMVIKYNGITGSVLTDCIEPTYAG